MPSVSPRLSLLVPNDDTLFITEDIAANWQAIDENVVGWLSGLASERPAAASGNAGFLFYATDTNLWTLSDGTTWETFEGPQGEPGVVISPTEPDTTDVLWADTSEPGDAVLPLGGSTGQSLVKVSGDDYDTTWEDRARIVNTDGDAGKTFYVGSVDPDSVYTLVTGDVWIEVPS